MRKNRKKQFAHFVKTIIARYKRIVASGKYINFLIKIRNKTNIVPAQNKYLFGCPGVTEQWIRRYNVLKKFTKFSKIENSVAMTSN